MAAPTQTVILLIMTAQPDEAERLITSLRNGGLPARGMYTANADRIEELIERRACDLILCCGYDPGVDLDAVLARHRELETDVPLVVIADHLQAPQTLIKALSAGARGVTERDNAEHLQLVVGRELADLRARRQVRRLTHRLAQCERRTRELIETTDEAVAFVQDGLHVHANPAYLSLFRYPSVKALQAAALLDLVDAAQREAVRNLLRETTSASAPGSAELQAECVRADASHFRATLSAAATEIDGKPCLRLIVRETERPKPLAEVQTTAAAHAGLPGYADLIAAIDAALGPERRPTTPFALFFVSVRGTVSLMQNFGLARGLAAVTTLTPPLTHLCADLGLLARVSDEGYGLLAPGLDDAAAETLAERIRAEVRLPHGRAGQGSGEPDCEVGYVIAAGLCPSPADLLDDAYRACHSGIGRGTGAPSPRPTSLAARSKQPTEEGDSGVAGKIEYALANDRFLLVYQPIISLLGDHQENYSVLVRLIDEAEQLFEAKDFIGPAIRCGLIERIDKWAIRSAIKALSEHRSAGRTPNFFINLAEDTFRDPGAILWICDCLREFDVRGSWLTFVIQEELVDNNLGSLSRLVESLKKIKCRVALNRFGATDHPQQLLQGLSLDFVLMLPEFAQGLADDKDKQQRLLTLANLAREFNVRSVVTGVEDARSLTILWTAGVDYVQGNFLQRPSPTLELAT